MCRKQAEIECAWRGISIVACCHSVKLCALAVQAFWSQHKKYTSLSFTSLIHENGQRWTCTWFKSCDFSTDWWIWMLSFLLEHILIGIDYFLLNCIATFGPVLGLQVTAGPQVNSGLQPPTRWELFVAGKMLHRPESTKETVEPMILSIIAIAITHLTRFTLLLLLLRLRLSKSTLGALLTALGAHRVVSN